MPFLLVATAEIVHGVTRGYVRTIGALVFGAVVLIGGLGHAAQMVIGLGNPVGGQAGWFLFLVILTETNDIAQALVGRRIGAHHITPKVSPNKTLEGLIGGMIVTVVVAPVLAPLLTPLTTSAAPLGAGADWLAPRIWPLAAGVVTSLAGFLGDLNLSALKRDSGVKDSSHALPGMGGVAGSDRQLDADRSGVLLADRRSDFMTIETARRRRRFTIPNLICLLRILAAPGLVFLAVLDRRSDLVILFLAMTISDWIDGKLAVLLDQRSDIGPQLDSLADATMYGALLIALLLLDGDRVLAESVWIAMAIGAYVIAGIWSVVKFGRWANHHTRMAKVSWGVMLVGVVAFLSQLSSWPLRVGLMGAALASVQSMMITQILPEWRADVSSPAAARRVRQSGTLAHMIAGDGKEER